MLAAAHKLHAIAASQSTAEMESGRHVLTVQLAREMNRTAPAKPERCLLERERAAGAV